MFFAAFAAGKVFLLSIIVELMLIYTLFLWDNMIYYIK